MYTKKEIFSQLEEMNAPQDSVVLMHSSLRAVGEVEGGGQGLLDIMVEYFTAKGGLFCVPTHTWGFLGKKDKITLDLTLAESNLGAFSRIAAADPRAVRSENPSHSIAVFGDREKALEFVRGEELVTGPTGPDTCYGKIYENKGKVLLVGVTHNRNTFLHCVDEMLDIPDRLTEDKKRVTVKRKTGEIIEREMLCHHSSFTIDLSLRFPQYETAFRYHRAITDGFVGNAPTQLCSARGMFDTVKLIFERSAGDDPLSNEKPLLPKLYC